MKLGFLSKVYKQKINWNQWKPFCSEVNENSVSKSLSNSKGQPIEREKDLKQRMAAMGFKEREVLRMGIRAKYGDSLTNPASKFFIPPPKQNLDNQVLQPQLSGITEIQSNQQVDDDDDFGDFVG
eukprot:TRINITY_DN3568_c0_g1_i4.p2 TRINITY_DN3568_c0_g1~~TRINITY_DN3568_c0_g1_i4.p2  ORF type:complete len:125 (+),score=18.10 TRINITY_DN3568_c0_g1_i4:49-423(+)